MRFLLQILWAIARLFSRTTSSETIVRSHWTQTSTQVVGVPRSETLLEEASRRAGELAVLEPQDAVGQDGPIQRFLRGRHAATQERLSESAAERTAVLRGTIAAEEMDEHAARAAAERARALWKDEETAAQELEDRVAEAEAALAGRRRQCEALSLRAKGYVGGPLKWVLVFAVALALAPLVYLSMESLDDPVVQIIVMAAATAGIFAAEHALGFAMAHVAQQVGRRSRIAGLSLTGLVIAGAIVGAEIYAGALRDTVGQSASQAGTFDPTRAANGIPDPTPFISMMWTVPLGVAATFAGSLIVALYVLGRPGRDAKHHITEAERDLQRARDEHAAAQQRGAGQRARLDAAEAAADAISGATRRAEAELRGAEAALAHARTAENGELLSNVAAAEMTYQVEREHHVERLRVREAEEAERVERTIRSEEERVERVQREGAERIRREDRDHAERLRREEREDVHRLLRDEREHADQRVRDEREDARHMRSEERDEARRVRRSNRKEARRARRDKRRAGRRALAARTARAVANGAPHAVTLGGPAATAGSLVLGLGQPALLAVAASTAGLTAAHAFAGARRAKKQAPPAHHPLEQPLLHGPVHALNGTSINGSHKEHA
jgi:hypothetical protein